MFRYTTQFIFGRWAFDLTVNKLVPDELEMLAKMPAYMGPHDPDCDGFCDDE